MYSKDKHEKNIERYEKYKEKYKERYQRNKEKLLENNKKYKKNIKSFYIGFKVDIDESVITKLNSMTNKSEYIKNLILKDIEEELKK